MIRREMARQPAGSPLRAALAEQYEYDAMDTCAADGSCKLVCPLGVDTGALVKALRAAEHGPRSQRTARAAEHWDLAERAGRAGLRAGGALARVLGDRTLARLTGLGSLPGWSAGLPRAASARLPATRREGAAAVYVPACINRILGVSPRREQLPLPDALVALSARGQAAVDPRRRRRYLLRDAVELQGLRRRRRRDDAGHERVVVPPSAGCCGMAGDRGLQHPELVAAATRDEATEVRAAGCYAHVSANRTCEIALEDTTGKPYESVVQLLERLTRA